MIMLNLLEFDFFSLSCYGGFNVVLGVRLHSPLGGKRSLGVKGLVGLNIEVEKSSSWRGDSFHGVWALLNPYAFILFYGRYK